MDIILMPLLSVIIIALNLYWWAVMIYVIMEWLEHFNIINRYNQAIYNIHTFLFRIVEPALVQIRRVLPTMGSMDISPIILLLLIVFVQGVAAKLMLKFI
ncbi:YggT family protein [Candidatus Paracaedibacter symbiosus]|uniref:YggT family protein n=1 Tax=Candidatus Paracaedibacter symbiosus TaxID=244582 RepID=UPI000509D0B8|nr:YggT family protein [Candidatus Paracaedibacter symbiosus]